VKRGPTSILCSGQSTTDPAKGALDMPEIDTGNTAWVLASAALVLLMTPGLALFYGGMVRGKSVLNMMMMSFGALGLISVIWVLYGFSMSSARAGTGWSATPPTSGG